LVASQGRPPNALALDDFLDALFKQAAPNEAPDWLTSPFEVPDAEWSATPLWVGHLTTAF